MNRREFLGFTTKAFAVAVLYPSSVEAQEAQKEPLYRLDQDMKWSKAVIRPSLSPYKDTYNTLIQSAQDYLDDYKSRTSLQPVEWRLPLIAGVNVELILKEKGWLPVESKQPQEKSRQPQKPIEVLELMKRNGAYDCYDSSFLRQYIYFKVGYPMSFVVCYTIDNPGQGHGSLVWCNKENKTAHIIDPLYQNPACLDLVPELEKWLSKPGRGIQQFKTGLEGGSMAVSRVITSKDYKRDSNILRQNTYPFS